MFLSPQNKDVSFVFSKVFLAPPSGSQKRLCAECSGVFLTVAARRAPESQRAAPAPDPGRDEASQPLLGIQNSWARAGPPRARRLF